MATAERPDAPNFDATDGTLVTVPPHHPPGGQRQRMASRFVVQPKLLARGAPFLAVRRDPAATRACERHQMRDLVLQSAQHFVFAKLPQPWIEIDAGIADARYPGRAPHS